MKKPDPLDRDIILFAKKPNSVDLFEGLCEIFRKHFHFQENERISKNWIWQRLVGIYFSYLSKHEQHEFLKRLFVPDVVRKGALCFWSDDILFEEVLTNLLGLIAVTSVRDSQGNVLIDLSYD